MDTCVIGIDVGGTNTDAVILKGREVLSYSKQVTTADVTTGVINALYHALQKCPEQEIHLQQINIGTTHFINAVVQRSSELSKVAVLRLATPPCTESIPPFYDFPKPLRQLVEGGWRLLNGGYEFDGREISPIDETQIREAVGELISADNRGHFVLSGVFSPVNHSHEDQAKNIILRHFPNASVTCSYELGHLGLLERENAAILNECLKDLAKKTLAQLKVSITSELGLTCPLYLTQNDGTVCSIEQAMQFPVLTFASGATNSMRGAAFVSGIKDAVVVDIGGTSTDVGVLSDGFPKEANSKIYVGGVPTFFRMPLTYSIGLGGGSIVRALGDHVTVGPDSVGYRLTSEALCFGGRTMTATDIAVAFGQAPEIAADTQQLKDIGLSEMGKAALKLIRQNVEAAIDHVKSDKNAVRVVLVGGGAILVNHKEPMTGCAEIISMQYSQIANAIGAALCQVSGSVDIVASVDPAEPQSRRSALDQAKRTAIDKAIQNGAVARSVKIVDCMELPLTYLPGNAVQFKVRAVGDLAVDSSAALRLNLEEFRSRKPPTFLATKSDGANYRPAFLDRVSEDHEQDSASDHSPYDKTGEWTLNAYDVECVSIGAGILGCGGGGSPHAGKIRLLHLLDKGLKPRLVTVDRLLSETPDAENRSAVGIGFIGAPVCFAEKMQSHQAVLLAVATVSDITANREAYQQLPILNFEGGVTYSDKVPAPPDLVERLLQPPSSGSAAAIMAFEAGGANSMEPLAVAASLGLPCVDVDGMGRAYPELQMYTPFVYGEPWNPFVQTNEFGRITISWTADSPKAVENFHRHICIQNGCKANMAHRIMPITKLKNVCIQGSISLAWKVGKAVLDARRQKTSPIDAVVQTGNGKLLLTAKIVDIQRRVEGGFDRGYVSLENLENADQVFTVIFQNENLAVRHNDKTLVTVPDLICILDSDTGDPITTEDLRYGLRVAVVILPPSPMLTAERALPVFGPKAFGLQDDYKTVFE